MTIEAILKEHAAVLSRRETARQAYVAADAEAQALTQIIREQGAAGVPGSSLAYRSDWLRAGERAAAALFETLLPEASPDQVADARVRWQRTFTVCSDIFGR